MMGLELTECDTPWFPGGNRLTSAVQMTGDWNGAVLMECDGRQACRFAARFLAREPSGDDVVDDDVRDVLGELANMIGGNLKSVLSRGIQLSMPSVVDGSNYSLRICGAEVRALLAFRCAEGLIWIRVLAIRS
jgi:CheY-specific phosphatase CheX